MFVAQTGPFSGLSPSTATGTLCGTAAASGGAGSADVQVLAFARFNANYDVAYNVPARAHAREPLGARRRRARRRAARCDLADRRRRREPRAGDDDG